VVKLPRTEYRSLDAAELERVNRLLHVDDGTSCLVVDFSAVRFFGAGLIGILVSAWDRMRRHKGQLLLCGLTAWCRQLLGTLCLDRLFEIYPTRCAALEAIGLLAGDGNGTGPLLRIRKSDVVWDPELIRLEYVDENGVPLRTLIVPRARIAGSSVGRDGDAEPIRRGSCHPHNK
jgi:anti-anti-sigma regulatory factor